jgi:hypothetical protein
MNEDIGKLIGNGFGIWRKNINLCIPFLLAIIFSLAAFVPLVAALAITFGSVPDLASISSPQEAVSKLGSFLPGLALAFLLLIVVLSMVNSFFASGAIAMAELALREGKTLLGYVCCHYSYDLSNAGGIHLPAARIHIASFEYMDESVG